MRLLHFEKYRGSSIRIYLKANVQHSCKIKLPSDTKYYELDQDPFNDSIDNLTRLAKKQIDISVDKNGVEYE